MQDTMYWLAILVVPSAAFALRTGPSSSRRLLACTLVLLVPVAGLFLAMLVRRVRGGAIAIEPVADEPQRRLSVADIARLGEAPPVLDRLLAGEPGERLDALVALSSAGDAAAIAVLRWALEHGSSEVVLDAALTLEELELRGEARAARAGDLPATRCPELAIAAAEALTPFDPDQARGCYQLALEWAPERALEIEERIARLELAAGRPRAALEILDRLICDCEDLDRITQLRDDAAFAARDFELMSFTPCPLEMPTDLRRASCKRSSHETFDRLASDAVLGLRQRSPAA